MCYLGHYEKDTGGLPFPLEREEKSVLEEAVL